ncbi:glycosyltransferase family 4 protein [Natronobeatus ordinarius]|uniref:glycosyltransferase family 4 protein n=1 Tax=Natronobeatus ordinarius TaxID=2963433 RepID=UPI0020CF4188|nr:glycosyltransferase family 4 protein [Natronobeatus ordinarius]
MTGFSRSETERAQPARSGHSLSKPETDTCNLLYVINDLEVGGAQIGMSRLLDGLDEDRYDVTIVTINGYDETFVDRHVPHTESILDCKQFTSPRDVFRLVSAVADADVIVGSLFHSTLAARLAGVVNRTAVVVTWQHNERFKSTRRRRLFSTTYSMSDVVLADSKAVAAMLRDEFGLANGCVETVPIAGIPLREFERREHAPTDPVVVGSVGVLSDQKNFRTLLTIADELREDGITFQIAGEGPAYRELASRIESASIENVELLGYVQDLPQFLNSIDIYIQPSWYEGLCITVVEAMAAALPVVGSSVGGIEHTVSEGECGHLHSPDDVEGFCRSIRKLAADPAKRQQLGDRGRTFVEQNYTQEVLVEEFERAIQEGST